MINAKTSERIAKMFLISAILITLGILGFIILFILINGLPVISANFLFKPIEEMGKSGGIFPTIISTIYISMLSIFFAAPLGVATAIYLTEYTRENYLTRVIRFGADCLAGIPSIIYGLFGFVFFVIYLKMSWSILSGALTLSIMMLPTIIRTSEEAIRAVPYSYREATYALGGSKWQGIRFIVIPKAMPGILTGIILSIGRAVSETAALIFTAGMSIRTPTSIFSSGRTMAVHFYALAREGISIQMAYGTAAILIITILIINIFSYYLLFRYQKKYS